LVEKLDRSSWFRVAARLLVERGGGGLRVEALCRDAGVTKGSFYHHFRDLGEFKTAFMDYLYQRGAMDPMSRLEALDSPRERLRGLIEAIACEDLALEAAVRRWAASDPAVAEHLRQVDQARMAFVAEMYHELLPDDPVLHGLDREVHVRQVVVPPVLTVLGRLGGADPVDRPASRHGHRPGPRTAPIRREVGGAAPDLQEDLLKHLFALGTIHQDLDDEGQEPARPAVVELREGVVIPGSRPANEGVVAIQILVMHSRMVRVPGARSDLIGLLGLAGPVRRGSATIIRR